MRRLNRALVCSSDDDHDSLPKTESCSLNPEAFELDYLHFNGDKLLWSNDLDALKNFVVNGLKLQGKWLTPGGNTKQFKSSNANVIINWYNKKQNSELSGTRWPCFKGQVSGISTTEAGNVNGFASP